MIKTQVLIVGAGPTGLVLALWLTRLGVSVRIIDKTSQPGTTSRALGVQARTLELYRQAGLTDELVARGHKTPAANMWVRSEKVARVTFGQIGESLSPYPFLMIFPQDEHERLLIEHLRNVGVAVERETELLRFTDDGAGVHATLRRPDGSEEICDAAYVAGCDGARSTVREAIGQNFSGGTYRQLFYVADIEGSGPAVDGELHVDLDEADFLAVFPLAGPGRARLIGTVRDERADRQETLTFADVSGRAIEQMKLEISKVNWFSTYRVHHRVAEHFSKGRAFLLGDAAHVHSPVGGQGMNTGIGDAINLAWKLAAVLEGKAPTELLASYDIERIGFARRLVGTTDRIFSFVTAGGPVAQFVRTRIAPLILPHVTGFHAAREYLFRTVSQIMINYRDSPLSEGAAGEVHGGDRVPWVPASDGGEDNYSHLSATVWQVQVYGEATPELTSWCAKRGLPLKILAWRTAHEDAGLKRNALYLLRPDTYVAFADPKPSVAAVERFLSERQLN